MKVGSLGSGVVGQTLGAKLAELDHEVKLGSRDPAKRSEWSREAGGEASTGTFEETAAHGKLVFVATLWEEHEMRCNWRVTTASPARWSST